MHRCLFAVFGWAVLASSAGAAGQAPVKLVSPPEVELPLGDAVFPGGPNAQAINDNCVACHSADHVMNQPSLSKQNWEEIVHKMVRAYKAPIVLEDQEKIVDYLTATKGLE